MAQGASATAMGAGTTASGDASTSAGLLSRASGVASFSAGDRTRASGEASAAFGVDGESSGRGSVRRVLSHTGPHTTAFAWCTPILEDFLSRRSFRSAHPSLSLSIPDLRDAFQLPTDAFELVPDSGRALFGDLSLFSDRVFDGTPLSKNARPDIDVALFVDEGLCIGCRACYQCAPETFSMDPELNVARVSTQWANDEMALEDAVQSCPKSCIHTVSRAELPMLEWIHASQPKQRVVPCTVESQARS